MTSGRGINPPEGCRRAMILAQIGLAAGLTKFSGAADSDTGTPKRSTGSVARQPDAFTGTGQELCHVAPGALHGPTAGLSCPQQWTSVARLRLQRQSLL